MFSADPPDRNECETMLIVVKQNEDKKLTWGMSNTRREINGWKMSQVLSRL